MTKIIQKSPQYARQGASSREHSRMTAVAFEPTQLALEELESTSLDHPGKLP